jgi:hypothetical protein
MPPFYQIRMSIYLQSHELEKNNQGNGASGTQ